MLIVEDEILIQKSLRKLLEKKGFDVDTASSGHEAIRLILDNKYNRIVCDLMLQDISGFDVIEESKQKYDLEEISKIFVIITAYSSPQVISKAEKYNCVILNKPFDNIKDTINTFITLE